MDERVVDCLQDILISVDAIASFTDGMSFDEYESDKVPQEMVDTQIDVKNHLLAELIDAIGQTLQRQAAVYRKFRQYLQDRWPTWEMPEDIESLVGDFKKICE